MNIEEIPITDLHPYVNNPRKNDAAVEAVAESIREFGFKVPIVIDKDNIIIAGHTRLKAAERLGLESVPAIRADDLTPEQVKAFRLADNKTAEIAEWDFTMLQQELDALDEIDMTRFGFEIEETNEVREDDYDPDPPAAPKTKPGDIYQLGRHRLMCGDSTVAADVAKLMNGRKADMLLTDPPYNVNVEESAGKIMNDNMDESSFRDFLTSAFRAALPVMRGWGAFHIWHASTEAYNFIVAIKDAGMTLRQVLIWVKSTPTLGRQDYQWQHEPCLSGEIEPDEETETVSEALYGWKDGTHRWFKKRKEKTILYYDKPKASKEHPTMKPVLLFDYEMQCNTQAGDAVLDLFGGSGTTLVAAEQNGRDAYIMELDPKFCDVIVDRWESLTGQKAVLTS